MKMKEKPTLYLIRGASGSGKSTYAKRLESWDCAHLEADMYFMEDGEYKFDAKFLPAAHKWCLNKTIEFLSKGMDVVVSNTFTRLWEMEDYLKIPNVNILVIEMKTQYKNVHGVPDSAVEKQKARWEEIKPSPGISVQCVFEKS